MRKIYRPGNEARPQVVCLSNVASGCLSFLLFRYVILMLKFDDVLQGCTILHDANEEQLFHLSHDVLYKEVYRYRHTTVHRFFHAGCDL